MTTLLPPDAASVFCDGTLSDPQLNHPEGVAVAADGALWCGGEGGEIFRVEPDGSGFEVVARTGGFVLGVAFDAEGRLYACDLKQHVVHRLTPATGDLEVFARDIDIPNWPVVDHERGVLYVSDSHAPDTPGGGVHRYDLATGEGGPWFTTPMVFANGMALAPGRDWLYVAETFAKRISRIALTDDGVAPDAAEVVVDGLPGLPDGLAFDTRGNLYVGCYEPSRVLRVTPDGDVAILVEDDTAHTLCHPTNVAFRGRDLFTANLGRWHLTRIEVGIEGLALLP